MEGSAFTIPGVHRVETVKVGDTITICDCYVRIRNPDRRWWQLWKPRWVTTKELQTFRVINERPRR